MLKTILFSIALFVIIWMISEMLFMDIFGIGRLHAKKKFPEAAAAMGLNARSPQKKKSFSKWSGIYKGRDIEVVPEMSSIKVMMPPIPGLFLNTFQKKVVFDTGHLALDRFFTARQAPSSTREKLVGNERLIRFLADFIKNWKRKLGQMDIEPGYVECRMRFGNGHYIPASVLEPMTSDLVHIVQLLHEGMVDKQPAVNEQ